jgi:glyoxylase-like metal-dependent hydrolase (beta-lactamase superfamily II)
MATQTWFSRKGLAMRIHHLNTGTMCPVGRRFVNGSGGVLQRARLVCHCLLLETNDGLALVDTGIGMDDIARSDRLGRKWVRQTAPRLDPAETAVAQVRALGYAPADVRHLLLTHLDRDHAGGIPDFPNAKVHLHRAEYEMAVAHRIAAPKGRYVADQWQHGPD